MTYNSIVLGKEILDKHSTRTLIVQVLAEEWPLSAKELYNKVKRLSKKELSYQAIHKILKALESDKIVVKEEKGYIIDVDWVNSVSLFAEKMSSALAEGKHSLLNRELVFETVAEADKFLLELGAILNPGKDDEIGLQWNHFWIPLFFSRDTYTGLKELITKTNFYCVTAGNSPIDNWCATFWNKIGVNEKTGVKGTFGIDMMVFQDTIIQVFYPKKIKEAIDRVYKKTKDPTKLDAEKFFHTVFEKKTRIPILISRNKEVAEELMKQTKAYFG